MENINIKPYYNDDNFINVNIINLTEFDIVLAPYGGSAPTKIKKSNIPQVVDEIEQHYLSYLGCLIPVCSRLCVTPLDRIENTIYIVTEKTKKCYKDRDDIVTIGYSEGFTEENFLIVRKLFK